MKKAFAGIVVIAGLTFGATVPLVPHTGTASFAVERLVWDTPSTNVEPGQYGLDETGKYYFVYYPNTPRMVKISTDKADVQGLTQVAYLGKKWQENYKLDEGEDKVADITEDQYKSYASLDAPPISSDTQVFLEPLIDTVQAAANPTYNGTASTTSWTSAVTSITWAAIYPSAGSNNLLFNTINGGCGGFGASATATYNAVGMTKGTYNGDGNLVSQAYFWITGATTGSHNIVDSFSSCNLGQAAAQAFQDTAQSSAVDVDAHTAGTTNTTVKTTLVTTINNDWIVYWTTANASVCTVTLTDTQEWNALQTYAQQGAGRALAVAASDTYGGTANVSCGNWDVIAVALKPVTTPAGASDANEGAAWFGVPF